MKFVGGKRLFSDFFHCRDQSDVRAANATLGGCHFDGAFGRGAAAILFRAVIAGALIARNFDLFGDGFVAGNAFFDDFDHSAFAAAVDFFGYDIIAAGFYLFGFGAISCASGRHAEHGAAGRKPKGKGGEGE